MFAQVFCPKGGMSMASRVALAAAALLGGVVLANWAEAQTPWERYREQLDRYRSQQAQRYEDWRQQQDQYRQERLRPGETANNGFQLNLRDSTIPPGNYRIQLPFGLQAQINVQGQNQPRPSGWGGSFYVQAGELSRRMSDDLRDIRYGVYQTRHTELQQQVDEALAAADQLQRAARQRAPQEQLRERFQAFDQTWHQVAHDLANRDYLNASWIRREVEMVSQSDNALHRMLQVGEAPVYDRLRVAALTRQLADATEHLFEDVKLESRDDPQADVLRRRAERVRRLAADLEQAVAQDAALGSIVQEYEEFDQAWHHLLALGRQMPDLDDHLRRMGRQIREIDLELHRELKVDPPVVADPGHLRQLAENVARQADHLADDLQYSLGERDRDVIRMADDFAAAARDLQRAVSASNQDPANEAQAAQRYWKSLYGRIDQLRGDRAQHAQERAAALDKDLDRLLALVRTSGG
jgi:hypothetical protein